MFKTHERSRFEIMNSNQIEKTEKIIVQIAEEKLYTNVSGMACFLCEIVSKEDFDPSTLEGRLKAAQQDLEDEIEANKIEAEEAQAKNEALEELLAEASDARQGLRNSIETLRAENKALYEALAECRRIFGELPSEIEDLLAKGEIEECIH